MVPTGWVLTVVVLQFWIDKQSILEVVINGGRVRPASALAQYVMKSLNPVVPEDLRITWDQVVDWTPWVGKHLEASEDESHTILRQPIRVAGEASNLELATEECYEREVVKQFVVTADAPGVKAALADNTPHPPMGRGAILKAHLDKMDMAEGWTRLPGKESGPDVG